MCERQSEGTCSNIYFSNSCKQQDILSRLNYSSVCLLFLYFIVQNHFVKKTFLPVDINDNKYRASR